MHCGKTFTPPLHRLIGICFRSHAWNDANLVKILHSPISIIKNHVVYSLLIAIGKACWSFVGHHTRVVPSHPRPKTNDALPRLDMRVTWKFIKDYCRAVYLVKDDGISIIVSNKDSWRVCPCNKSTIVKTICPACKHSGADWKYQSNRIRTLLRSAAAYWVGMQLNKLKCKYSPHYACKVLFLSCSYAKKKVVKQSLKHSLKVAKKKMK